MNDIEVTIMGAEFHRNGVCGEAFYAVAIRCDGEPLVATIGYKDDGETFDTTTCRVANLLNVEERYRGDLIGDVLVPKLKAYIQAQEVIGPSEEKNITKKFGCYSAELNVEREQGELVSWCHVSTTRRGVDYCSSLGVVETYGTIEHESGGEDITVPESVVARIHNWADANGY